MLQAAIGGLILLGIYKWMNSKSEYEIDWWIAAAFIFAPGLLILLIAFGLGIAGLNANWMYLGYLLYFIIPFVFLSKSLEFDPKTALKYASVVPVVAILTEIPFALFLSVQ